MIQLCVFLLFASQILCQDQAIFQPLGCKGENKEFKTCGSACPLTCATRKNLTISCTKQCVPGCFCKEGYLMDERTRKCVKPHICDISCGENQEVRSCTDFNSKCEISKEESCVSVCVCKEGYIFSEKEQKCIETNCKKNEAYYTCASACPITCLNRFDPPKFCPAMCKIGCDCAKGFLRNDEGDCVLESECPNSMITEDILIPTDDPNKEVDYAERSLRSHKMKAYKRVTLI